MIYRVHFFFPKTKSILSSRIVIQQDGGVRMNMKYGYRLVNQTLLSCIRERIFNYIKK